MTEARQFAIRELGSHKQYVVIDAAEEEQALRRFRAVRDRVEGLPGHDQFEAVPLPKDTPISVAWFKDGYFIATDVAASIETQSTLLQSNHKFGRNSTLPTSYPDKALTSDPRLVQLLIGKAFTNGHDIQRMCDHLRVTLGFFHQLRNGVRKAEDMGEELTAAIVEYLEVPSEVVMAAIRRP